jgi:transcriptional repressor NrdR
VECPNCQSSTRVLETRREDNGAAVKRRRECPRCGERFTTFERRERPAMVVSKRDGRREPFDAGKLRAGMLRAAYKRPVEPGQVDAIVARIEGEVERAGGELEASRIGELCLAGLGEVDRVAYLQFAAVYRQLADVDEVQAELRRLRSNGPGGGLAGYRVPSDSSASITSPPERVERAGQR